MLRRCCCASPRPICTHLPIADIAQASAARERGRLSWLLDLTAQAPPQDPKLEGFSGHVSDSGEARWNSPPPSTRAFPPR